MENITYKRISKGEVDKDLTEQIEQTRAAAWRAAFPDRSPEAIKYQFNPESAEHMDKRQKLYAKYARRGSLVTAFAGVEMVGVGMAINEVSVDDNFVVKAAKRLAFWMDKSAPEAVKKTGLFQKFHNKVGNRVYAKISDINVLPSHADQGIDRELGAQVLEPFEPTQVPTMYLFEEDVAGLALAAQAGFRKNPAGQTPTEKYTYFGPEQDPVQQLRFAHDSVTAARDGFHQTQAA